MQSHTNTTLTITFTHKHTHTHLSTYKAQLKNIAYYQTYLNSTKQIHTHKQTHADRNKDRNTPTNTPTATPIPRYTYTTKPIHTQTDHIHMHIQTIL